MNAGTILYIPVAQAEGGATVTVKGQLYGPTLKLDGTDITTGTAVTIATDSTRYVPFSVEGTGSLYLTRHRHRLRGRLPRRHQPHGHRGPERPVPDHSSRSGC